MPYAPGVTPVWTTYTYDQTGRPLTVVKPDGSSTTTYLYQGNATTVTDPAGKSKTSTVDAFGNLATVIEDPYGAALTTTYTYNALNQLTQVSMPRSTGTQTRTFAYTGSNACVSKRSCRSTLQPPSPPSHGKFPLPPPQVREQRQLQSPPFQKTLRLSVSAGNTLSPDSSIILGGPQGRLCLTCPACPFESAAPVMLQSQHA